MSEDQKESMWNHVTSGKGLIDGLFCWASERSLCPCMLVGRVLPGDERFDWVHDLSVRACTWFVLRVDADEIDRQKFEALNSDPMFDEDPWDDEFNLF